MSLKSRVVFAIAAGLMLAAPPALAQRSAAEIALSQSEATGPVTVLGEVRAEIHQKSMMPKTPSRDLADQQLKEKAAKLGADAVVGIKYDDYNPMTSKKGFIAVGKAVKFTGTQFAASAAPAPPAPVSSPPPALVASTPPALVSSTPPALASAPSFSAAGPPALIAPPAPVFAAAASSPGMIPLISGDAPWPSTVLGDVRAEIHQKSMMPKTPSKDLADAELRAQAAKLGADAVVGIKYENYNSMTSKKGFIATGKAVKATRAAPLPVPVSATPPPAPVIAQPAATPAPPPALQAQIVPVPARPAAATAPAPGVAIALSEGNSGRVYTVLGPVSAELNQQSLSLDKTGRQVLDDDLRAEATKIGADAVLMIRYSPASTGRAPSAIGIAVKFK